MYKLNGGVRFGYFSLAGSLEQMLEDGTGGTGCMLL